MTIHYTPLIYRTSIGTDAMELDVKDLQDIRLARSSVLAQYSISDTILAASWTPKTTIGLQPLW